MNSQEKQGHKRQRNSQRRPSYRIALLGRTFKRLFACEKAVPRFRQGDLRVLRRHRRRARGNTAYAHAHLRQNRAVAYRNDGYKGHRSHHGRRLYRKHSQNSSEGSGGQDRPRFL